MSETLEVFIDGAVLFRRSTKSDSVKLFNDSQSIPGVEFFTDVSRLVRINSSYSFSSRDAIFVCYYMRIEKTILAKLILQCGNTLFNRFTSIQTEHYDYIKTCLNQNFEWSTTLRNVNNVHYRISSLLEKE